MKHSTHPSRLLAIAATGIIGFLLTSTHVFAAIEELDSATMSNSNSGELACFAPGRVPLTARLPAVAGEITEVKLHGRDLVAADYDFSLSRCNGDCSVLSATGSGSLIRVKARLGGANTSVLLEARKKADRRDLTTVRFDVVENSTVTNVTPLDGVLIGRNVEISGTGLSTLDLQNGANCFDVASKTATKIILRSKCEQNNPSGVSGQQSISLVKSGPLASACKMLMAGKDIIRFAASQSAPTDLAADFGPFSSFTRVDPVTPDRRVADSFCAGPNPDIFESDSQCTTQGSVTQNNAQGIGGQTNCVTTAVKTQLFRKALTGKIQLTVKNVSSTELNRPFDVEIRAADGLVLKTQRLTSILRPGNQLPVEFVRPVGEIGFVKVTAQSGRDFLLKYGQPGCYRAKNELAFLPAAANDYSEVEFVGVVDAKNEIDEGANGKANNTVRLLPK